MGLDSAVLDSVDSRTATHADSQDMPDKRGRRAARIPLDEAIRRFGPRLLTGVSPSRRWGWEQLGVPSDVWGPLALQATVGEAVVAEEQAEYQTTRWRQERMFTAATEMVYRLAAHEKWQELWAIVAALEVLSEWGDEDWERIYRMKVDHLVQRLRHETKR